MPPLAEDASPQPVPPWLDGFLDAHLDELVAFRRRLHAHPEVSWAEVETTAAVIGRLRVAGLSPSQLPESTGLVCDLATGTASSFEAPSDGRPVVALRADLDALAMEDEKDVAYRSTLPGVAHACGHDVHTTVVLGAALALAEAVEEGELTGAFRFIFEPAEEALPGGAPSVIDAGALGGVSSMLGVHCDPKIDVGQVALRTGPITSAADMARITILGPGGHTARPELTVNLLAVLGQVQDGLYNPGFDRRASQRGFDWSWPQQRAGKVGVQLAQVSAAPRTGSMLQVEMTGRGALPQPVASQPLVLLGSHYRFTGRYMSDRLHRCGMRTFALRSTSSPIVTCPGPSNSAVASFGSVKPLQRSARSGYSAK